MNFPETTLFTHIQAHHYSQNEYKNKQSQQRNSYTNKVRCEGDTKPVSLALASCVDWMRFAFDTKQRNSALLCCPGEEWKCGGQIWGATSHEDGGQEVDEEAGEWYWTGRTHSPNVQRTTHLPEAGEKVDDPDDDDDAMGSWWTDAGQVRCDVVCGGADMDAS